MFFILGNEFCERYAYYGMRAILVIYLKNFLGFDNDYATTVYHAFVALCYFFPLIGGIIADSFWGKVKTILILSIVYLAGMVLMAVAAVPQIGGNADDPTQPGTLNDVLTYIALLVIAIGTGGIKPCVSSLGGDQFADNEVGREQVAGFFSLFYASINAGSLLSTFISPILREEVECFEREDCFFIAFLIPAILMFVAILAFLFGKSYYVTNKPSGNIFVSFCKATWLGLRGKCKSEEKKEHFLDYAIDAGEDPGIVQDIKYVYPIIVMFLPLPFFWALFDMQGSRWTISATQMNGWQGGDAFKMRPDQIQILNPIMILLFLPLFSKVIYPLIEKCGIRMTSLRRMSAGQIITALSFVVSGFVQMAIDEKITPIPDYGNKNSMMVLNGMWDSTNSQINVQSEYWGGELGVDIEIDEKLNQQQQTEFKLNGENWRTETFAWIKQETPVDVDLKIGLDSFVLNKPDGDLSKNINVRQEEITSVVYYKDATGQPAVMKYVSPYDKSDKIRVKTVIVNPTKYFARPYLTRYNYKDNVEEHEEFSGNAREENRTVVDGFNVIKDDAEFDQGIYKIHVDLFENGDMDTKSKNLTDMVDTTCVTDFIWNDKDGKVALKDAVVEDFAFSPGSIWTLMIHYDEKTNECKIRYGQDSNGNEVNIFLLVPQYVVITIGEVMNSATGLEFAYTQAPPSMKSVVQSFWLLTTCVGNIIDIFFVEIKLAPTQTGEYFVLALIMFGASLIFVFLSMFYYEYVPEDAFAIVEEAKEVELETEKADEAGEVNEALNTEEAVEDKKANEGKVNQTADL